MNNVFVILSEKFPNAFITTSDGHVFYQKDNYLKQSAEPKQVDLDSVEIRHLIAQGILQIVENKSTQPTIIKPSSPPTVKEVKTTTNDKDVEQVLNT